MSTKNIPVSEGRIWNAILDARQALADALGVPPTSITVVREGVREEIEISWTVAMSLPSAEPATSTSSETESGP